MVLPPFPLSLPPPKIAKDAAKASKRIDQEHFQPIVPQTLTQLLGFPNMEVTQFYIEEQDGQLYLHLECQHRHDVAMCEVCAIWMYLGCEPSFILTNGDLIARCAANPSVSC
jgi:hypothetical protein